MPVTMDVRVFISYRRSDSRHLAGRLRDRMADAFGDENVFFDVESIGFGMDFREVIRHTLGTVDVVLTLVGPGFSPQRLARPDDVVRLELTTAFDLQVPVVPVLVEAAEMPRPETLPEDLRGFAYLHAARLRADPDFRPDADRLVDAARRIAADRRPGPAPARPTRPGPVTAGRPEVLVDRPGPGIAVLAFSPDGTFLAAGSDREVHLWDPVTGGHLRTVSTDGTPVDLAFSPRLGVLAVATSRSLQLFDPATGRADEVSPSDRPPGRAVASSPDGRLLAGSGPGTVHVWQAMAGHLDLHRRWHARELVSLAFSPDGRMLAGAEGAIRLWNPDTGVLLRSLTGNGQAVNSVAFSPGGRWLAGAGDDGTIRLWDPATGRLVRSIRASRQPVRRMAFSPDGSRLASTATSETVRLWDPATGERVEELSGHSVAVRDVAFSPDGSLLATCGGARRGRTRSEVLLWDLAEPGGPG
jgi:uncharacterized protein with WD repeat